MTDTYRIQITFPTGVVMTKRDEEDLINIADRICKRWEAEHPGHVMWPAGIGAAPVNLWSDEPSFDESTYSIDCDYREVLDSAEREPLDPAPLTKPASAVQHHFDGTFSVPDAKGDQ